MYVGEVRQQVQSINSNCQSTVATMEQIQQALSAIIIEPGLKGATYDSMKNYFNTVYMPVTKGFILVCERMIEANKQFLNRYLDQVDVNSLQESVLEERIRQYNRLSEMLDSIVDPIGFNARMIDGLQDMRQETVRKLDALREYDYFSIQIFDELESQLATLEAGVSILAEGKAWNQSTGTFSTMGLSFDWAVDINSSWKAYDDKKKGIDEEKEKELKEYKVYAMIYMDADGNPKVSWQLEKNGKGVMNPELYQYLAKAGKYLDADSFEFITQGAWDAKVKDGWRNGFNYVTGEVYNKTLGKIVSNAQSVEDGINWLNESEMGQAIQVLGFSYALYKITTPKGKTIVSNQTGTVWDDIKPTQPLIEGTSVPKSFELNVNGEKFWVNPNGTKHIVEYSTRNLSHGQKLTEQQLLTSLQASTAEAIATGYKYNVPIKSGNWEIIFSPPREIGQLPVIKHAQYMP